MSNSEDEVLKLVGMTYEAALDESKWPSFLEAFASRSWQFVDLFALK